MVEAGPSADSSSHPDGKGLRGAAWVTIGSVFVGIGIVGIFIPLLPTTPFLLLAAACYARGSRRLYDRLLGHKILGPPIRNYREGRGVTPRAKVASLVTLYTSLVLSAGMMKWDFTIMVVLLLVGIGVSAHILMMKVARVGPET